MFNGRDRRCAAVQVMLSTYPSYDNGDHCQHPQNVHPDGSTLGGHSSTHQTTLQTATFMVFGVVSSEGHIVPPHFFEVGLKVNTKAYLDVVIPSCNQVAGGRSCVWQQDSAPAHKSKETQAWLQKECNDFVPFSHWPPSFPRSEPAGTTLFDHTSRTSPTWPPTTSKPAWSSPSTEYLPSSLRRLWKWHALSSGSVSRRWLMLMSALLHNQATWIDFFNKSFKIKL